MNGFWSDEEDWNIWIFDEYGDNMVDGVDDITGNIDDIPVLDRSEVEKGKGEKKKVKRRSKIFFKPFVNGVVEEMTVKELNKLMVRLRRERHRLMMVDLGIE